MTSKEDLKKLKDAFLTIKQEWLEDSNVKLTEWQKNVFKSLEKDLEEYEELKELMVTPIQDIIKRLKILEILKEKLDINNVLNTYNYLAINPNHMYFKSIEEEKLIRDFLGK